MSRADGEGRQLSRAEVFALRMKLLRRLVAENQRLLEKHKERTPERDAEMAKRLADEYLREGRL
jgi:hypothetical protein